MIKKTITIPQNLYDLIMNQVEQDFRSNFNREINYILTSYFEAKEDQDG